jgi:hypothetical protein
VTDYWKFSAEIGAVSGDDSNEFNDEDDDYDLPTVVEPL